MFQSCIYDLSEASFHPTRKDIAEHVAGVNLIPDGLSDVKIAITQVESGGEFPQHKDPYHHIFYFISGTGIGWVGKETYDIKPGRVVQVPAGVPHGYKNTSNQTLHLITLNLPV